METYKLSPKQETIKGILEDEFSEENVDCIIGRNVAIFLIHFPEVTVRNEYDESIDIFDLYVKIRVGASGYLEDYFTMLKATYTTRQWLAGYSHSHLRSISGIEDVAVFSSPCLGTGPIADTQHTLMNSYSQEMWGLFAFELSKYVTVESISGVPYIKMSKVRNLGSGNSSGIRYEFDLITGYSPAGYDLETYFDSLPPAAHIFIPFYIKNTDFPLTINSGNIEIGMSDKNFMLDISNKLVEFCKTLSNPEEFIRICLVQVEEQGSNYLIVADSSRSMSRTVRDTDEYEGRSLGFNFKGKEVTLHFIKEDMSVDPDKLYLVNPKFAFIIKTTILKLIKYGYKNRDKITNSSGKEFRFF